MPGNGSGLWDETDAGDQLVPAIVEQRGEEVAELIELVGWVPSP